MRLCRAWFSSYGQNLGVASLLVLGSAWMDVEGEIVTGIEPLISLLIYLIIGGILIYIVMWIVGMLAIPQPIKTAITILIALIVVLWILSTLGIFSF